jgi:hypothetical protein
MAVLSRETMEPAGIAAHAWRTTGRGRGLSNWHRCRPETIAALCLLAAACRPPTMVAPATPNAPGAAQRALVLGRVQMAINGRPVRVAEGRGTPPRGSAGDQAAPKYAETALTMLVFRNLESRDEFAFDVPDDSGGFEVLLPPGRYSIRLRYEDWLSATPAMFDAAAAGESYYVGTLRADLFRRRSLRGWWARAFGGTIPRDDSDFAVTDEWEWARANLGAFSSQPTRVRKRLMSVE